METNVLLVKSLANIFSNSVGCLFVLFMVSFVMQKILHLIRSHLFTFVFISITLGGMDRRRYCCDLCQKVFFLGVPVRVFIIVSGLTFRSFVLVFLYVKECSNFIFLHLLNSYAFTFKVIINMYIPITIFLLVLALFLIGLFSYLPLLFFFSLMTIFNF